MHRCMCCGGKFHADEVQRYNINGDPVEVEGPEAERNTQNPDYGPYILCHECDELRSGAGVSIHEVVALASSYFVEVVKQAPKETWDDLFPARPTGYEREWNKPF